MDLSDTSIAVKLPWQEQQWQRIDDLYQNKKLPHALLLAGPNGVGKQRFALALAHYFMCESPRQGMACCECRQCGFNLAGTHPDLKWVGPEEKAKQIKVDQVRALVEALGQTAQQGGYKICVLSPAEAMNTNSANALLKCLEEPTANTLLLLLADAPSQLLPTIRSRCQTVNFPLPSTEQGLAWLNTLVPSQTPVEELLHKAAGRPLVALDLLEDSGLERLQQLNKDYLALVTGRVSAITLAEKWLEHDLNDLLVWLSRQLSLMISGRMAGTSGIGDEWRPVIANIPAQNLFNLLDRVNQLINSLNRGANPNRQLALEELLLESCEKFHK
ncbi:DNA polymerase III subunit delta' [Oceanicoccus sagamiensis]|uniref:DNA polymerase III subunit delta' n=1 Tax=Oceanicoccus sagamiensis TaxID=716816 RepID=A0A1X9NEF1_9GAMM|nr:DNA polymerase III subunit delta' [Oceanicoccus sagamiensis]ARN75541.1 DNA polymerase III subunit delta' [Oceanicoccus sagamiensis]